MGYHRPVASWNKGKQSEHHERACFLEPKESTDRYTTNPQELHSLCCPV